MEDSEEVENLANSLKSSGLAASMMDAVEKAKQILGFKNKGVNIRVETPKPDKQEKVDEIIKEVDKEIEQKAPEKEEVKEPEQKTLVSSEEGESSVEGKKDDKKFEDPSFNVADSEMSVKELTKEEIMTNDHEVLNK